MINKKQMKFIDEYMKNGFNGADAYKRAYKSCKNNAAAKSNASRLLTNDNIKEEIERRQKELQKKSEVEIKEIIYDLKMIKDYDIFDYMKIVKENNIIQDLDITTGTIIDKEVEEIKIIYKDTEELTKEQRKCIKNIEMTKFGPKYTFYDKLDCIDKLNKMLGYYQENLNLNSTIDTSSLKDLKTEDLFKLIDNMSDDEDE